VLIFGAPDSVRCAPDTVRCTRPDALRTIHSRVSTGHAPLKFTVLSDVPPDCPVSQRSNGSLRANSRFVRRIVMNSASAEVGAQKSEVTGLSSVAPDCPVQQDDKALQRSTAPNPNGRADVARTGQ
jgi:hypothetical protein